MKYLCDPQIIPTNTCPPDLLELGARTKEFASYAPYVQLDIADGDFAPVTSWPYAPGQLAELSALPEEKETLPYADQILYEAHLMVRDPHQIGGLLARAGVARLLPHVETYADTDTARAMFDEWRNLGAREIGLSILLETPLDTLDPFIPLCDVVQVMSIAKIGAQGQPFDERALTRVEELHARHPDLMVAVDGGVSEANVESLVRAGANRLCVGAAISRSDNPALAYARIHERAMLGCAPQLVGSTQ